MTPSPNLEGLAYLTLSIATILVSTIKEIMGISQTVMFPDSYSRGILTWMGNDSINWTFHDMAVSFPRLEEFGGQGPTKVGQ